MNTENGDFSQSATDLSVPTFGPSLDFTRTYDAQLARQETVAGTPVTAGAPGSMGFGWTNNWDSSLAAGQPVPGDIYTIDGTRSDNGNGGPPASVPLQQPDSVVISGGNTYIADSSDSRILEVAGTTHTEWGISMTAGDTYVIVGSPAGVVGDSPGGTPTANSLLDDPQGLAIDGSGNLYIADTGNNRVVEAVAASGQNRGFGSMTVGDIYNIAGHSQQSPGHSGDGGLAQPAFLDQPVGVSTGHGNSDIYIADSSNNRVQEIPAESGTQWGQSMTAWDIYTVTGNASGNPGISGDGGPAGSALLNDPQAITFSAAGDMYIADTQNNRIQEIPAASGEQWGITPAFTAHDIYTVAGSATGNSGHSANGTTAVNALLNQPAGVVAFNSTQLYITDAGDNRVEEVARSSHTEWGIAMTANDIYTIAGTGSAGFSGDGGLATSAKLNGPSSVWLDPSLNMFIADSSNNRVRQVSASTGDISEYAGNGNPLSTVGNGAPATTAGLLDTQGVAADAQGDVFIADSGNNRVQEIAASTHSQFGISMTAGDVYTVAGKANGAGGISGDGSAATSAFLDNPLFVAVDSSGNLFIDDAANERIQEVPAATGTQFGQSMTADHMYTVAGSAAGTAGITGDGGPATSALLDAPFGVAVDGQGDVFIADQTNNRVQEVPAVTGGGKTAGDMYTVAGSATGATGSSGDGGPATSAKLQNPSGLTVDTAGNLYISDSANDRVQEVPGVTGTQFGQSMTAGDMYTIAGTNGTVGAAGDGGPATSAQLSFPAGVAVDSSGDVYIADAQNSRVQEIAAVKGTQWGQSMTPGDIYTVAGSATGGFGSGGIGGPATSALFFNVYDVAVDPSGDLFLPDDFNSTVDEVVSAPGSPFGISPPGGGVTVTQGDGSQVTFYPQSGGRCTAPYVAAGSGGYCTLPENISATLSFSSGNGGTYTYSPDPGDSFTYGSAGALTSQTDAAGNTLSIAYGSPAPGSGNCPAAASSCETVTSASGRALTIGYNSANLVTSVTDPLGRQWTYGYTGSDLTSATDPMGNKTTYTYGAGSTGNPQLANDLTAITGPNAQPGGPDAGDATINVYDSFGRVTKQTDPMGFATTFNYCVNPANGQCMNTATGTGSTTITDPNGNTTIDSYTAGAQTGEADLTGTTLTSSKAMAPQQTATGASAATQLDTATIDGNGNVTTFSYNTNGYATTTTEPTGVGSQTAAVTRTITALDGVSCDSSMELPTACSSNPGPSPVAPGAVITPPATPAPGVTETLYDTDGNELYTSTGVVEPGANSVAYVQTTYQLFNGNSIVLNGSTIRCSTAAPTISLPCATINADGVVTQLQYNSAGDLTSSSTPDGNGSELATATYSYNGDGQKVSATSPNGNLSGANAGNYTTTSAYNADGELTSTTEAGGSGATVTPRTTSYGYDADGNQTTVTDARGFNTSTGYNADNEATLVTDPDGNSTLTCYDGSGNVAQTVPAVGVAANNLTPSSCPATYPAGYSDRLASDATASTYNADGLATQRTTPAPAGQTGNETTSYVYDGDGNVIQTTAPPTTNGGSNQVTVDTYDSADALTSQTTGSGTSAAATISYCYDPNGNQTSVVYADGNTSGVAQCEASSPWVVSASANPTQAAYQTTSSYDSAGELVSTTAPATAAAPSGATTTSTYDPAGNMLTENDPKGITTTWTYTPLDQSATITYSGGSAHSVSFGYDANGDTTSMSDATGNSSSIYDPFGEQTSTTDGAGQTTGFGYNADGQMSSITYPLPSTATWATTDTVGYTYDHADLLTGITDFNNKQITVGNTADGMPNSVAFGSSGDTVSTTYDNTDSPSVINLKNSSTTLQSFTYSNSQAGGVLSETDTPSSPQSPAVYSHDAQGRITSMTSGSGPTVNYGFDASGNLTTLPTGATGSYDKAGELTSSVQSGMTTTYTYDANGQRLSAQQGSTTLSSANWNGAGQLAAYSNSSADMTAASYDGNGLRASAATGGVSQAFTWDTTNTSVPRLLMDSTNAYVYDDDNAPVEQVNLSTGSVDYLVTDALDSVRGTVNGSGTLTGTTSYDAWGNPATAGGLTATTPFGFAGGYTDPTGLIYLVQRYYDPATGQFISVDPLVAQTNSPYAYANGDPVDNVDPTGAAHWVKSGLATWGGHNFCVGSNCIGVPSGDMFITAYIKWFRRHEGVDYVTADWGTVLNVDKWSVRWVFIQPGGAVILRIATRIHKHATSHAEPGRFVIDKRHFALVPHGTVIDGILYGLDTQKNVRYPVNPYPHEAHILLP